MVFSSLVFLLYFFPIALIGYILLGFSLGLQNLWLFAVSIVFYAWGEPSFVIILIVSIVVNWLLGIIIGRTKEKSEKKAKTLLAVAVIANLGILFVFKYIGFFIDTVNGVIGSKFIKNPGIALPIGISFFTFQAISYVVDVYRGEAKAQKNIIYLGLYIALFPQLVAGPIVRYNTIEESIHSRTVNFSTMTSGINRFAIGLVKKVLLANNLGLLADTIFNLMQAGTKYDVSVVMAWTGLIGYYFQLFFDFSAYSDMAIGLGKVFGFTFEENFNYPYISKSIGEQWRISGHSVLYFSSSTLFDVISRETFSYNSSKSGLENIYNCDLLIIDDLGTEMLNNFTVSSFFSLINERALRRKKMVITTNLTLPNLRDMYTDRTFSRLAGSCKFCHMTGEDIRRVQKIK